MNTSEWWSQFANDPSRDFELYLELLEGREARARIERGSDGKLYLVVDAANNVRVPLHWLVSLAERAETLPVPGADDDGSS
jgi:hypothetical protein